MTTAEVNFRFKIQHLPRSRIRPDKFAAYVQHANLTGQINTHRTKIFKDIMATKIVTICTAVNNENDILACGYSFCRGDAFDRKDGRWRAENRLRAQLDLELIPRPKDLRRRQVEAAKARARWAGLAKQKEVWDLRFAANFPVKGQALLGLLGDDREVQIGDPTPGVEEAEGGA